MKLSTLLRRRLVTGLAALALLLSILSAAAAVKADTDTSASLNFPKITFS